MTVESTSAAYRPVPKPSSPRWARASLGLSILAWATLIQLIVGLVSTAILAHAQAMMWSGGFARMRVEMSVAFGMKGLSQLLVGLASIYGAYCFAQIPRSSGATGRARVAVVVSLLSVLWVILGTLANVYVARRIGHGSYRSAFLALGETAVRSVLGGTFVGVMVAAIKRAMASIGAASPRYLQAFVIVVVTGLILSPLVSGFDALVNASRAPVARWGLYGFESMAHIAIIGYWIHALRTASRAIGGVSLPEEEASPTL